MHQSQAHAQTCWLVPLVPGVQGQAVVLLQSGAVEQGQVCVLQLQALSHAHVRRRERAIPLLYPGPVGRWWPAKQWSSCLTCGQALGSVKLPPLLLHWSVVAVCCAVQKPLLQLMQSWGLQQHACHVGG